MRNHKNNPLNLTVRMLDERATYKVWGHLYAVACLYPERRVIVTTTPGPTKSDPTISTVVEAAPKPMRLTGFDSGVTLARCPHCWTEVEYHNGQRFCQMCGKPVTEGQLDKSHRERGELRWAWRLDKLDFDRRSELMDRFWKQHYRPTHHWVQISYHPAEPLNTLTIERLPRDRHEALEQARRTRLWEDWVYLMVWTDKELTAGECIPLANSIRRGLVSGYTVSPAKKEVPA